MILVFGANGQVGQALAAAPGVTALGRAEADLSEPGACTAAIRAHAPKAVINAAAWTDVDGAEGQEAAARLVNADAPGEMARVCAALDVPFAHISTDYVFDGTGTRPWVPGDAPAPLGAYGRTKLAGEQQVADAGGRWVVLRTSWVFSGQGRNFVTTMLRLGAEREALTIVADQIGGPTPAGAIADACLHIARALQDGASSGIYHFAGAPDVSWADFARAIFEVAGLSCNVTDIASTDWPTPAARPANSRLDCTSLVEVFGIQQPDWRDALRSLAADLF